MKVLVSGSTGMIGRPLVAFLAARGHSVSRLVRRPVRSESEISWSPEEGRLDTGKLDGFDAVVHLAAESIADRWTEEKKRRIKESRVVGTTVLSKGLAGLAQPPKVYVCASAVGIYGNRDNEVLTEESRPGEGFLSAVCQEWEAAAQPARDRGIRTVNLRIGVVLGTGGGALSRMLLPFKMGLGGELGSGRQWMSWIAIDDVVGAIHHVLTKESLEGPVNCCAPNPVTNAEFTHCLGRILSRPTFLPAPMPMLRLALGEMAEELLLSSQRMSPAKLQETGYQFKYPTLEEALRAIVGH